MLVSGKREPLVVLQAHDLPKSTLDYKQSLDHDLADRPALHLVYKKSPICPPDSHGACSLSEQHACLLVTHRRKKVPLLFKVLDGCA